MTTTRRKYILAICLAVFLLAGTAFLIGYTKFVYYKAFKEGYVEALVDAGLRKPH